MEQSKVGQERLAIALTRTEVIRLGDELRPLLSSNGFQKAVEVIRLEFQSRVFNSSPAERSEREAAYQEARAFESLLSTLNTFVAVSDHEALMDRDDEEE